MGCLTDRENNFRTGVGNFLGFSRDDDHSSEVINHKEDLMSISHVPFDCGDNLYFANNTIVRISNTFVTFHEIIQTSLKV